MLAEGGDVEVVGEAVEGFRRGEEGKGRPGFEVVFEIVAPRLSRLTVNDLVGKRR